MFYQETCCILRDLWEKTMYPLYSAVRLELAFCFKDEQQINDQIRSFATSIFSFFNQGKLDFDISIMEISPDLIFVTYDPLLRFILSCEFVSRTFERLNKCSYEPYDKRIEQNKFLTLLTLTMKDEEREDLSNNLESIFIASEINEQIFNDDLNDLKNQANSNDEAAKLILFVGELYMELCFSPILIKSVIDSNVLLPDVVSGYLMSKWLYLLGLKDESAPVIIDLLVKWSSNRNILLYFLALLDKRSETEPEIVENILPKISSFCTGEIEKLMQYHKSTFYIFLSKKNN